MITASEEGVVMDAFRQKAKTTNPLSFLLFSAFYMLAPAHSADFELSPDGSAVVRLVPQGTVTAGSLDTSLLNSGWTATTDTGGALSVTSYNAGFKSGLGGAEIKALYDHGSALGSGKSLEWVQVINTNAPLGGATSPYLDNAGKPSQPFYTYTVENRDPSLPPEKLNFYDFSKRDPATLSTTNPIEWNAALYPVVWDGGKALTVQDGASWGWTMKKATIGTDSGVFVNPSPSTAVVSGVGTNTFSWGSGDSSSLSFAGGNFDATPGTPFTLGRLTFHNGVILSGTGADSVDFKVAINFDNVPEKNLT
ncbi:MAG: choice-of-anchor K domain-containing protein, partial [Nitrosospira sp.]